MEITRINKNVVEVSNVDVPENPTDGQLWNLLQEEGFEISGGIEFIDADKNSFCILTDSGTCDWLTE